MKKTAVLVYDTYCNFEICVALEGLALSGREVVVFSGDRNAVKSEEGLHIVPDQSIDEIDIHEFDSLLLPGAADIRSAVEDERIPAFIRKFRGKTIGAISIAPVLLVKAGLLSGRPFMAGVNKDDLLEEGFTSEELAGMVGWDECTQNPISEGYIMTGNIVTSVAFHFVRFGLQFCRMLGIDISPMTFGL